MEVDKFREKVILLGDFFGQLLIADSIRYNPGNQQTDRCFIIVTDKLPRPDYLRTLKCFLDITLSPRESFELLKMPSQVFAGTSGIQYFRHPATGLKDSELTHPVFRLTPRPPVDSSRIYNAISKYYRTPATLTH